MVLETLQHGRAAGVVPWDQGQPGPEATLEPAGVFGSPLLLYCRPPVSCYFSMTSGNIKGICGLHFVLWRCQIFKNGWKLLESHLLCQGRCTELLLEWCVWWTVCCWDKQWLQRAATEGDWRVCIDRQTCAMIMLADRKYSLKSINHYSYKVETNKNRAFLQIGNEKEFHCERKFTPRMIKTYLSQKLRHYKMTKLMKR